MSWELDQKTKNVFSDVAGLRYFECSALWNKIWKFILWKTSQKICFAIFESGLIKISSTAQWNFYDAGLKLGMSDRELKNISWTTRTLLTKFNPFVLANPNINVRAFWFRAKVDLDGLISYLEKKSMDQAMSLDLSALKFRK